MGKNASFSSNYANRSSALYAVDGNKDTSVQSCTETEKERKAWVMVDLETTTMVKKITVYTPPIVARTMGKFDVRVGDNPQNGGTSNFACSQELDPVSNVVLIECPRETMGQYVTINVSSEDYLEVCEIEVYGDL